MLAVFRAHVSRTQGARCRVHSCRRATWHARYGILHRTQPRSGRVPQRRRLSGRATYSIFARRAEQAEIPPCRPHDARRTWLTGLLKQGVDVFIVSRLAGHSLVETTKRYDMRDEEESREAARRLELEYRGRSGKWGFPVHVWSRARGHVGDGHSNWDSHSDTRSEAVAIPYLPDFIRAIAISVSSALYGALPSHCSVAPAVPQENHPSVLVSQGKGVGSPDWGASLR